MVSGLSNFFRGRTYPYGNNRAESFCDLWAEMAQVSEAAIKFLKKSIMENIDGTL